MIWVGAHTEEKSKNGRIVVQWIVENLAVIKGIQMKLIRIGTT
jgi:hypothetical protein